MIEKRELTEVFGVPDVFTSGLGSVEDIGGGNWRFVFYVNQEVAGEIVNLVVAKLVMSIDALPAAIHMAAKTTSTCACENMRRMTRN
jgi:hypothetical protein